MVNFSRGIAQKQKRCKFTHFVSLHLYNQIHCPMRDLVKIPFFDSGNIICMGSEFFNAPVFR